MVKKQQMSEPVSPISQLQQFSLGFEYNKTLQEVKRDVRVRTHKNA